MKILVVSDVWQVLARQLYQVMLLVWLMVSPLCPTLLNNSSECQNVVKSRKNSLECSLPGCTYTLSLCPSTQQLLKNGCIKLGQCVFDHDGEIVPRHHWVFALKIGTIVDILQVSRKPSHMARLNINARNSASISWACIKCSATRPS